MHEIISGLYLSGLEEVETFLNNEIIHENEKKFISSKIFTNLNLIVSIGCELNSSFKSYLNEKKIENLIFQFQDQSHVYIFNLFCYLLPILCNILNKPIEKKNVIIHCVYGQSRSVSLVLSYLSLYNNMNLSKSYQLIKSIRPKISVNPGFLSQIGLFNSINSLVKKIYQYYIDLFKSKKNLLKFISKQLDIKIIYNNKLENEIIEELEEDKLQVEEDKIEIFNSIPITNEIKKDLQYLIQLLLIHKNLSFFLSNNNNNYNNNFFYYFYQLDYFINLNIIFLLLLIEKFYYNSSLFIIFNSINSLSDSSIPSGISIKNIIHFEEYSCIKCKTKLFSDYDNINESYNLSQILSQFCDPFYKKLLLDHQKKLAQLPKNKFYAFSYINTKENFLNSIQFDNFSLFLYNSLVYNINNDNSKLDVSTYTNDLLLIKNFLNADIQNYYQNLNIDEFESILSCQSCSTQLGEIIEVDLLGNPFLSSKVCSISNIKLHKKKNVVNL